MYSFQNIEQELYEVFVLMTKKNTTIYSDNRFKIAK